MCDNDKDNSTVTYFSSDFYFTNDALHCPRFHHREQDDTVPVWGHICLVWNQLTSEGIHMAQDWSGIEYAATNQS